MALSIKTAEIKFRVGVELHNVVIEIYIPMFLKGFKIEKN